MAFGLILAPILIIIMFVFDLIAMSGNNEFNSKWKKIIIYVAVSIITFSVYYIFGGGVPRNITVLKLHEYFICLFLALLPGIIPYCKDLIVQRSFTSMVRFGSYIWFYFIASHWDL